MYVFVVYVIVSYVVNVCMLPQLGKNGYADWYDFKSKINRIKSINYNQFKGELLDSNAMSECDRYSSEMLSTL